MPVTYATPEPFAPGISSAYGAAQQWSQDAGVIANAEGQANQLQAQRQAQSDQLRFAYAKASADNWSRQADRYAQSEAQNADREQGAMNLGATLTQRNYEAAMQEEAASQRQIQGAELQNWLGQQELSQKDNLRLQQMRAAVADVEGSNLTPEQKQDTIMRLRTGIDPLEQRMKTSQAKMIEQHGRLYEMQLQQESQQTEMRAKIGSMTASQRIYYEVPQEVSDMIEAQVNQSNLTPQDRDREVQRLKRSYPGAQQFIIGPDNQLTPVKRESGDRLPEFDVKGATAMAEIEADAAHPPGVSLEGKPERIPEWYSYRFKVLRRMQDEHGRALGRQEPPSTMEQGQQGDANGIPPAAMPPPPARPQPKFELSDATRNPEKLTDEQRNQLAAWRSAKPFITGDAVALTPEQKKSFVDHVEWAERKLAEFGSLHAMAQQSPLDFRRYMAIATNVANIPKKPVAKPAEPPRRMMPDLPRLDTGRMNRLP